jgi:septum formation protein
VKTRLVLASASPRRAQLLAEAGLRFEIIRADVSESATRALTIQELTALNASRKSREVARKNRDAVVLGADTLVALDGEVIGKPANMREAVKTLQRLSAREHQVCTSVCICSVARQEQISFCTISHVRFKLLNDDEIRDYLSKIDPLDKAGAYAAQAHGSEVIGRIRGSYTNVVGLPMGETLRALRHFGIKPGQVQR